MTHSASIRQILRRDTFRGLIGGGTLYFVGNAMQVMATAWLMVELTGSSILTALVQTAVFLPMFLLSLPAGVLADVTDRARLLRIALLVQAATVALLTALLLADLAAAATLLVFTFVTGCCTAMLSPAWNTTVADSVPRKEYREVLAKSAILRSALQIAGEGL